MRSHRVGTAATGLTAILAVLLATPALAGPDGLLTTWQAPTGNWSDAPSWSGGEPTTAHTAEVPTQSQVTVDQSGEVCLALHVGIGDIGFGAMLFVVSGSLTVGDVLRIGTAATFTTGVVQQSSGVVTIPLLICQRGGYTAGGGTTAITECRIDGGSATVLGGATVTVTTDVSIETQSLLTVGGGTFVAGTSAAHGVTVRGEIAFVNPNVSVTLQNLTLEGFNSRLRATIGPSGFDAFTVEGTFARDGRFIVNDFNAPYGRYDILTAGVIDGDFASVELPAGGEWSWGIENTTLFAVKGEKVPVSDASWGELKNRFAFDTPE